MPLTKLLPLVYLAIPTGAWIANALLRQRRLHWMLAFLAACLIGYVTLLASVQLINFELERELYEFDLDGDGSFSESEMTPAAERAMNAVTSDTGRALAPITGIPITLVWATICFLACSTVEWLARFFVSFRSRGSNATSVAGLTGVVSVNDETGNPYQPPPGEQGG